MDVLVIALQGALVLVIVLVLVELVRLQRAVRTAQLSLPDIDEVRRLNHAIRESALLAEKSALAVEKSLQSASTSHIVEHESSSEAHEEPEGGSSVETEVTPENPKTADLPKRGPRVLSEAGRAKYDKVLHLAARGLDIDSIAREVDLTRAEVELMLGSVE